MKKEMFLFIVAFILRIYSVRTDDDYDIETTEMGTLDYVVPTATTFMEGYEGTVYYTFLDEEIIRPNINPDVYNLDVKNRKPYQPYTPLNIPNIDFANRKTPKMDWEPNTVPTYTDKGRWRDYKSYFAILGVVLLVIVTLISLACLRFYCKSKKLQRNVPPQIIIIYNRSGSSQSDTVSSDSSSAPNRSFPRNFESGAECPQRSYPKDFRFNSCKGVNAYPEPPPPYE